MKPPISKLMSPRIKMDYFQSLKEKNVAWMTNAEKNYVDNSVIAIRQRSEIDPSKKVLKRNIGADTLNKIRKIKSKPDMFLQSTTPKC